VEIIPLFGRLSAGEQQRVFAPATRRKVVVSTNIAETSLTIPGIRYVIDSGLARISRYNPRTRTRRLPIEPIAQSSANQRKGRSGRVQNGVCIRLYSEDDFAERPQFTQPEIQRANLAEVILRMKAFRLGEIEIFPFFNPPSTGAIEGGYRLLHELGALTEAGELTELGRDLARLPIDPTLGRMLLQAQHEHATRELLIIAAGQSIQDPRERPLDQKDQAAAAHKRFADPRSDFLTLLNIWNAVHDDWETLRTQNQRRKFCKTHFLSYLRMREWQDLHAQLQDALEELATVRINESNAHYEAIHRSILSGLLGHIATHAERNAYQAPGNRRLNVFPGSALFEKAAPQPRSKKSPKQEKATALTAKSTQPEWIVAGEIVETSQLFARTVAGIDPEWIIALAPHLCKTIFHNPHWSVASGRVLAEERTSLYGLEIRQRKVAYGNVNPGEATAIFIRSALVEADLSPEPQHPRQERDPAKLSTSRLLAEAREPKQKVPARYDFIEHNRHIRHKIQTWQTRMRRHDLADLDDALFRFYSQRIQKVSSFDELNRFLREHSGSASLRATETDLIGDLQLRYDATAFPDDVRLGEKTVPLSYAYSPGEEWDGVTVKLDFDTAQSVSPAAVEWAVPGLRESLIAELLRALPKAIRRELMPFAPKVAEIARELRPSGASLKHDLARFIKEHYKVEIPASAWPANAVPDHLRPRVEVVGHDQKTVHAGRDLGQLRKALEEKKIEPGTTTSSAWNILTTRWERFGLTSWNFGDLPEQVSEGTGAERAEGWPGLRLEEGQVNLRLFRTQDSRKQAGLPALQHLVELTIQKDLAWLQKDLRTLERLGPLVAGLSTTDELQAGAYSSLRRYVLPAQPLTKLIHADFQATVDSARQRIPGLAFRFIDQVKLILEVRQEVIKRFPATPSPARSRTLGSLKDLGNSPVVSAPGGFLQNELNALMPKNFLETAPFERLADFPRYLKALRIRSERAALNPVKDQERARLVAPFVEALKQLQATRLESQTARQQLEEFRWMVEEFKVSVFAQELGTAVPVSAKRLEEQLRKVREA
jgi:ATP-dependent helicase HrpA